MADELMTGASLEEALESDRFEKPAGGLVGMVKSAGRRGYISFSRTDCESWVDVPTDLVEQAEHLGQETCKDHSHPVFKLSFKAANSAEAQTFMELLTSSSTAPSARAPSMQSRSGPTVGPGPGGAPSYPSGQPSARLRGGFGGVVRTGGLSAWGCWQSECCECVRDGPCWYTGDGRVVCECAETRCEPCERCIWPW